MPRHRCIWTKVALAAGLLALGLAMVAPLAQAESPAWLPLVLAPPRATVTPTPSRAPTATATRIPTPTATVDPATAYAAEVVAYTNLERTNRGLPPLRASDALTRAAAAHSLDMATHNFFDHTGSDGSDPGDRITRTGYVWRTYGENIAAGYPSAQEVVAGWMGSSGHRANILNPNFAEIGVGYVYRQGTMYGSYWTQVFAAPW
jgi:uncharacterized protein YkwD